jgi:hypothetical protein
MSLLDDLRTMESIDKTREIQRLTEALELISSTASVSPAEFDNSLQEARYYETTLDNIANFVDEILDGKSVEDAQNSVLGNDGSEEE